MSFWIKNGKIVVNSNGNPRDGEEHCPCQEPVVPPGPGPEPSEDIDTQVFANIVYYSPKTYTEECQVSQTGKPNQNILIQNTEAQKNAGITTQLKVSIETYSDNPHFEYSFLRPISSCNIYQLRQDSKMYKNDNNSFILSGDLNNTTIPFPINENNITINIPQQNITKNTLLLQQYNNNIGQILPIDDDQFYNIFVYKKKSNTHIDKKLVDKKQYYCEDIVSGITSSLNIYDLYGDAWLGRCNKIYTDNTSSVIYLTFIDDSYEYFNSYGNRYVNPTIKVSNNHFVYKEYYQTLISCEWDQNIHNPALRIVEWNKIYESESVSLPPYLSTINNNIIISLTDDYQMNITQYITGNCNGNILIKNINQLTATYRYEPYVLQEEALYPHTSGIFNGEMVDINGNDTRTSITYNTTKKGYYFNDYHLTGGMLLMYDDSGYQYTYDWDGQYITRIGPQTSTTINGTVVKLTDDDEIAPITNIQKVYSVYHYEDSYPNSKYFLKDGQKLFYPLCGRIEKLVLQPSCYWSPSITQIRKGSTIINNNDTIVINEKRIRAESVSATCNGHLLINVLNNSYQSDDQSYITYRENRFKSLPPHTTGYVYNEEADEQDWIDITGNQECICYFSAQVSISNTPVMLTNDTIIQVPENHYLTFTSKGEVFHLEPELQYGIYKASHNNYNEDAWVSYITGVTVTKENNQIIVNYDNNEYIASSGWFAQTTDSGGIKSITNNNGVWTIDSNNIVTGSNAVTPPEFYYNNTQQTFYYIFSSLYITSGSTTYFLTRRYFDINFGNEIIPNKIKKNDSIYEYYLRDTLLKEKYNDLEKLYVTTYQMNYSNTQGTVSDFLDFTSNNRKNLCLSAHSNFTYQAFRENYRSLTKNCLLDDNYIYIHNHLVGASNGGSTYETQNIYDIVKFFLKQEDNTENYTGVCCQVLTSLYVASGMASDTPSIDKGYRQQGMLTGNLKLNTYYSIGMCIWNLGVYNNIQFMTTLFNKPNLNSLTVKELVTPLSSNIYNTTGLRSLTIIKPLKLIKGSFTDTFDAYIIPQDMIKYQIQVY